MIIISTIHIYTRTIQIKLKRLHFKHTANIILFFVYSYVTAEDDVSVG
jgi:hypothetical protein